MTIADDITKRVKELSYPNILEIRQEVFKGFDDFVGTDSEKRYEEVCLNQLVYNTLKKRQEEYNIDLLEIEDDFAYRLRNEYGPPLHEDYDALSDTIFMDAYKLVHMYGYYEVELAYRHGLNAFYQAIDDLARNNT